MAKKKSEKLKWLYDNHLKEWNLYVEKIFRLKVSFSGPFMKKEYGYIYWINGYSFSEHYDTPEEAKIKCIEKLKEIVNNIKDIEG